MKKINLKLFLIGAVALIGIFLLFFISNIKVSAQTQDNIVVETTGYSILGPDTFVFGGAYSGNFDKKAITTYFEFKEGSNDLDVNREETIPIVRGTNADGSNEFYTSPELRRFTTYYFRAVGYLNDSPNDKIYGEILSLETGDIVIPTGYGYVGGSTRFTPFTMGRNGGVVEYNRSVPIDPVTPQVPATCVAPEVLNSETNTCDAPPVTCTPPEVYSFLKHACENFTVPKCTLQQYYNLSTNTCINYCSDPNKVYDVVFDRCVDPVTSGSGTTNPSTGGTNPGTGYTSPTPFTGGLVKCGTYDSAGKISHPCGFNDVMTLINDIVTFIFTGLAIPFAAIMFAYAGFEMITSGGNSEKRSQAVGLMANVAIGLVIVASAYLIVHSILVIAGYQAGWNWFGL